jgi:hypothetical protein
MQIITDDVIELRNKAGALYAKIINGALVIRTRQHGENCDNVVSLLSMVRMVYGENAYIVTDDKINMSDAINGNH